MASVGIWLALASGPATAVTGPWVANDAARVRLVSRWSTAPAGGDPGLALQFELAPGWHVYWKNAGDAGYPPALAFDGDALQDAVLRFPAPRRFDLPGDLVAFGYAEEVTYPVDGRLTGGPPASAVLAADLDYLACASECVPYRAALTLELPTGAESAVDPSAAPIVDAARGQLPSPVASLPGARVDAELRPATGSELTLVLSVSGPNLSVPTPPELFFETNPLLSIDRARFTPAAGGDGGAFAAALRPLDETRPLPSPLAFAWTATGFRLDGEPIALDGTLELARPGAAASTGERTGWLAALAALAALAWWISRRLRSAGSPPAPSTPGGHPA